MVVVVVATWIAGGTTDLPLWIDAACLQEEGTADMVVVVEATVEAQHFLRGKHSF